jgi:formylglycine-generating enzyme required for sulfatase activity
VVGETVSHYRVLEELGGGAMGVVYKAQDTRLKRLVALKFLPPALTRDADAKQRFVQEAEAASALDDPHVGTIYDIDESADGRVFIAMAFYEGETLKKHIQRGPLPIDRAVSFATQIAQGLAAAHEAGIVHRDIKPANVMITRRDEVKIVDFGIAKLSGADLTRTGSSLGTVAYMAPEQFRGLVDARVDLWALGIVLYEMLTGRRPFVGADDIAIMASVNADTPRSAQALRPEVPQRLAAIVDRALQKDPAARFASAREMLRDLEALRPGVVAADRDETGAILRAIRRPVVALPVLAVIGVVGYLLVTTMMAQSRTRWAREEAIPQIRALLQQDDYTAAYALAQQAAAYIPNDPVLAELRPQITNRPSLNTKPPGASVFVKPYAAPASEWRLVGTTPLEKVEMPFGAYRWRVQADGFETIEFARNALTLQNVPTTLELKPAGSVTAGMVAVPASREPVPLTGFALEDRMPLAAYEIGRHEVTNREFKAFVDAGGYAKREFWKHEIAEDGRSLPWEKAIELFRDSTGRPGPATWELGTYPSGQEDFPVSGVSWYEAAAYAEYKGVTLPSLYHWAYAALAFINAAPMPGQMAAASNFGGAGPVGVTTSTAIGPQGAYDMAGNVREWCWNESGPNRWMLGGSWSDVSYMSAVPYTLPPLDRSAGNGFRIARYSEKERVAELTKPVELFRRDFRNLKPASDEVFEVYKRHLAFVPAPLNARVDTRSDSSSDWVVEQVSFDTGFGERMAAILFIPRTGSGPYQAVVGFPGLGVFLSRGSRSNLTEPPPGLDFFVRSGRILVLPVYKGSFERFDDFITLTGDRYLQTFRQRMREWRQETGQLLDYLASRPDVQADRIAYFGASFGASTTLPLLAMEQRYKAAVLQLAGFTYRMLPPEIDAVNFAPRITMPVLMLDGRFDHLFPLELSQKPLYELLGSPPGQKKHVLFDAGHGALPRGRVISETLTWLDTYLGPVK